MSLPDSKGWHSRGYLPHFDPGCHPVSITYRLAGSLPEEVLAEWKATLAQTSLRPEVDLRIRIENYLDTNDDVVWLRDPRIGSLVEQAFLFFDGTRYRLHAWVVMPNHVHVLITPMPGHAVRDIVYSWKSYTAHRATTLLQEGGRFWQPDYFDRLIRDQRHFEQAVEYIEGNPVKAGLCASPADWPFSSARWRLGREV